jgi:hypothetical protein
MHGGRFATARYTPSGFRFRYRKVWGFKSFLVHYAAPWGCVSTTSAVGGVSTFGVAFVSKSLPQMYS